MRFTILCLLFALQICARAEDRFVFVSVSGEQRIATLTLDVERRQLKPSSSIDAGGKPGAMAIGPNARTLFASIRSAGKIASFRIDEKTGELTRLSEIDAGADPSYVSIDRTGRFMYTAYYREGKVKVHEINTQGKILRELQSIETDERAHCVVLDRTNRFCFVPHTSPNAIFQFRVTAGGLLSLNDPPKVQRSENTGPRHLWFHPERDLAFSSDEQGRSISSYKVDTRVGTLTLQETLSSLPPDVDRSSKGSTSDIEVHPSGEYVYIANRGHDSIAGYRIDQENGRLSHLGNTETEGTTRSFNIDPTGQILVAAGQRSGKLAVFEIDCDSGDLVRKQTVEIGTSPWWVQIR